MSGKDTQPQDPVRVCTETMKTIQMVSDALLLRERDRPLSSQTFAACCESASAKTKQISLAVGSIEDALRQSGSKSGATAGAKACGPLAELAEGVCVLVENTAQAIFAAAEKDPHSKSASPGIIDPYPFTRGRLAIQFAVDGLKRAEISSSDTIGLSSVIASNLERLQEECTLAAEASDLPFIQNQFKSCIRALAGTTAALVAAIKEYVREATRSKQRQMEIFATPVLACVDSLVEFIFTQETLFGSPPKPSADVLKYTKPIQAAALTVVSATALFVQSTKAVLVNPQDNEARQRLTKYGGAVEDGLIQFTSALHKAKEDGIA